MSAKKDAPLGETRDGIDSRLHLVAPRKMSFDLFTCCSLRILCTLLAGDQRLCPVPDTLVSEGLHKFKLNVVDINFGKHMERIQKHWVLWQCCELKDYPKEGTSGHGNSDVCIGTQRYCGRERTKTALGPGFKRHRESCKTTYIELVCSWLGEKFKVYWGHTQMSRFRIR